MQERLFIFVAFFVLWSGMEALFPRRSRRAFRIKRWSSHLIMLGLGQLLVVLVPLGTASLAFWMGEKRWGLFHWLELPVVLNILMTVLVFDFLIYIQHILSHRWGWLWRIHSVHHSDPLLDASSALRFHPLEIIFSFLFKCFFIVLLGPSAGGILLFEVILNVSAMFNHSNIKLPKWFDRMVRVIIVTPDMHRSHHHFRPPSLRHNYGFCFSFWDRVFRTYESVRYENDEQIQIGLEGHENKNLALHHLLSMPWRNHD